MSADPPALPLTGLLRCGLRDKYTHKLYTMQELFKKLQGARIRFQHRISTSNFSSHLLTI